MYSQVTAGMSEAMELMDEGEVNVHILRRLGSENQCFTKQAACRQYALERMQWMRPRLWRGYQGFCQVPA